MRQHHFLVEWLSSTILIFTLIVILTAPPYLVFATASGGTYVHGLIGYRVIQPNRIRYEYHCWAIGQNGSDPGETVAQATVATPVPTTSYHRPQRHVARGAARGAALGAVGGAITGDPAKGAAAGAAMGGTAGVFRRRDARRQQPIQQQPMQSYPQ